MFLASHDHQLVSHDEFLEYQLHSLQANLKGVAELVDSVHSIIKGRGKGKEGSSDGEDIVMTMYSSLST